MSLLHLVTGEIMKFKKLISGLLLSTALAAGVGVFAGSHKAEVKNVEAAQNTYSFYVAVTLPSSSHYIQVYYNAGYNVSDDVNFNKTGHTYHGQTIFSGSIYDSGQATNFDGVYVKLMNGSTKVSEVAVITSWSAFTHSNQMLIYSSSTWTSYSVDSYRIKCGSDNYVTMNYNEGGGLPEGVIGQFAATLNITAGESLTIQKNTGSWGNISPSYSGGGNNYDNGQVIISVSSAQIWLKYKNDGSYEVWVPGYTACAVIVGGVQYITNQSGEGSSATYTTNTVYVDKTQTVQVSWNHSGIDTYLNADSTSGCFTGSAGTVTCTLTGAYTIQVHNNGYGQHNTVYITRADADTAKYLAQKFNNTISPICSGIAGGTKALSDLQAAWGSNSSSDLYKHFNGQPSSIKAYFGTSSGTSDADILACVAKYDYIELKYGTTALPDFIGRNNGYKSTPQGSSIAALIGINNQSAGAMISIIAISSVSIAAIGGYFLFKKKKND